MNELAPRRPNRLEEELAKVMRSTAESAKLASIEPCRAEASAYIEALRAGLAWGIDGIALVMACSLLTLRFFRMRQEIVAAGFLVFAIGESLLVSGAAMDLAHLTRAIQPSAQPDGAGLVTA